MELKMASLFSSLVRTVSCTSERLQETTPYLALFFICAGIIKNIHESLKKTL